MKTKNKFKTVLTLALVALAFVATSASAANPAGELGILNVTANGGINPNTGVAWQVGDQYRLAFHTLGKHNATSNDPAVYNAFVTAEAQLNPALVGSTWFALVSVNLDSTTTQALSPKIDAKTNSGTDDLTGGAGIGGAGVPVYAMDGTTCIARNNADIWNSWSNPFDGDATIRINTGDINTSPHYSPFLDQHGNQTVNPDAVHGMNCMTGSNSNGTARTPLGNTTDSTTANWGSSNANRTGRVWVRWDNGSLTGDWSFYAISEPLFIVSGDPNTPEVDAGVDMITLSGMDVAMAPDVDNNDDEIPQRDLTHTWSADPVTGVVITEDGINPDNPATKEATVTITKTTANPSTVTLTLKVDLDGTSATASDTMEIDVYNDACLAAKAVGPVELDPSDFDENCTTDLRDYAILAAKWLEDYKLTAPVPKP